MPTSLLPHWTVEQYLQFDASAPFKHEYLDGHVTAMAGGSFNHSVIAVDAATALRNALSACADRDCRVLSSDMRLGIPDARFYTYPDLQVLCGDPVLGPEQTLLYPDLVVEVLSPSTRDYDPGGKFELYRRIASLKEYVAIDQDAVQVNRFTRMADGSWRTLEYRDGEDQLPLQIACGISIRIAELYAGVLWQGA